MPDALLQPVFAQIDVIIGIVVVLVSIIGWLVNLINENAKKNNPPVQANQGGGGGRPADDRFQQEIDDFLQQVGGKPQPRRHQDRAVEVEPMEIEVVPEKELWEREREERRQRELSSLADRHVTTSVASSIDDKVREDIDVEADLGQATNTAARRARRPTHIAPGEIVSMLRDPDGVRKAIIVNEILQRPSRRR